MNGNKKNKDVKKLVNINIYLKSSGYKTLIIVILWT